MASDNPQIEEGNVSIVLTLEGLLSRLEAEELARPPAQRREIPNIPELARIAGVHRVTMYNLVKGNVKHVNLELLSTVLSELRRRGFEVAVSDLLHAFPAEQMREPA